jgi:hypothetical protein
VGIPRGLAQTDGGWQLVETETDQAVDDRLVIVPSRVMVAAAGMATGDGSVQIEANAHEVRLSWTA